MSDAQNEAWMEHVNTAVKQGDKVHTHCCFIAGQKADSKKGRFW